NLQSIAAKTPAGVGPDTPRWGQERKVDLERADRPAATHDRTVVDLQPIGQHRNAGLPRRPLLQPMLQCRHVDDSLVQFDAMDRQVAAARTDRPPWQRQRGAIRAQERSGSTGFTCNDVANHERWHRRQPVLATGRADLEPQRAANLMQDQSRGALRLGEIAERYEDQRQHDDRRYRDPKAPARPSWLGSDAAHRSMPWSGG